MFIFYSCINPSNVCLLTQIPTGQLFLFVSNTNWTKNTVCLKYKTNHFLPFDSSIKQKNVFISSINGQMFSTCLKYKACKYLFASSTKQTNVFCLKYKSNQYLPFGPNTEQKNIFVSSINRQLFPDCVRYKSN